MGNAQGTQAGPIECDILIVGAGATGLGAAYRLNQLGYENWALVDAGGNPGGSCGTIKTAEGFRFDLSQHAIPLNSKYEATVGHFLSVVRCVCNYVSYFFCEKVKI